MKKLLAMMLSLALSCSLLVPALASEAIAPAPPEWCPAEEYVIFEQSAAYQGETWDQITALREHAQAGNLTPTRTGEKALYDQLQALKRSDDPGILFEVGLVAARYAANALDQGQNPGASTAFEMAAVHAAPYAAEQPDALYLARLWNARMCLLSGDLTAGLEGKDLGFFVGAVEPLLPYGEFTMEALYGCPLVKKLPAEQLAAARALIFVTLDGKVVHPRAVRVSLDYLDTTAAQSRNNRTMVPVRRLAELMGATVDYDAQTQQITITRAGDTIVMTLNSEQALLNGTAFQMDVAPFAEDNRTYIPIRYIAEFFGQKVDWVGPQQHVVITEDKSVLGDSNLERWALGMGAVLSAENHSGGTDLFGGKHRFGSAPVGSPVTNALETTGPDFARQSFQNGWSIDSRETLTAAVDGLLADSGDYPAWNLFRVSSLAQWGYLAGYVTYAEALELVEPAATRLCAEFSSWDEAYESYLRGYARWSGTDTPGQDIWQTPRGLVYQELKADPATAALFDDTLFQAGVVGLPE